MRKYIINEKPYFTICSIHEEIRNIFRNISKINHLEYKNSKDLYDKILKIIEFGIDYSIVATEMGQHMEDGLKYNPNTDSYIYSNIYNSNQFNLFDENEGEPE